MKPKILFLVAALFLMGEVPASAQNNFLKKVGGNVIPDANAQWRGMYMAGWPCVFRR